MEFFGYDALLSEEQKKQIETMRDVQREKMRAAIFDYQRDEFDILSNLDRKTMEWLHAVLSGITNDEALARSRAALVLGKLQAVSMANGYCIPASQEVDSYDEWMAEITAAEHTLNENAEGLPGVKASLEVDSDGDPVIALSRHDEEDDDDGE